MKQEPTIQISAECIGGPLDGAATAADECAFPWPHGWYYIKSVHGVLAYVWDGDPDLFIEDDMRLHTRERRIIWPVR